MKHITKIAIASIINLLMIKSSLAISQAEEIDMGFSKASLNFIIDYELLRAIAYASSEITPNSVEIDKTKLNLNTIDGALDLINSNKWLMSLNTGNVRQYIVIDNLDDVQNYMSKFGKSRDYSVTKIKKENLRVGIMGLRILNDEPSEVINIQKNIYLGAKRFKNMIKKYGLRNAINLYCDCINKEQFVMKASEFYFKNTNKKMSDLYIN
jgi:hypothetical protein